MNKFIFLYVSGPSLGVFCFALLGIIIFMVVVVVREEEEEEEEEKHDDGWS